MMLARLTAPGPRNLAPTPPVAATNTLVFGTNGTRLLAVVAGQSAIIDLGAVDTVMDLLRRLEFAVSLVARDVPAPTERQLAAVNGIATELDTALISPLAAWLVDGPVRITPPGLLAGLPWRLLPTLERRSLSIGQPAGDAPTPLRNDPAVTVVLGPDVDGNAEAATILDLHANCTVLAGLSATVERVRDAMAKSDVVHLAAHGRLDHKDPLLSHLELADGAFTLYDIETLPRLPHTVILACCRVAGAAQPNGAYGLATVLRGRGCEQVAATALPLADRHSAEVMGELHRLLRHDHDLSAVLGSLHVDNPYVDVAARSLICLA